MRKTLISIVFLLATNVFANDVAQLRLSAIDVGSFTNVKHKLNFIQRTWHKIPDFNRVIVHGSASFDDQIVHNVLQVDLAKFLAKVKINNIEAYNNIDALWGQYKQEVDVSNCALHKSLDLSGSYFSGNLTFSHFDVYQDFLVKISTFEAPVLIEHSNIYKLDFSKSKFNSTLQIINTNFKNEVVAKNTLFEKLVTFHLVNFRKGLDLSHSQIHESIIFKNILMAGTLNLSHVKAHKLDLTNIHFDKNQSYGSDVNKIKLNLSHSEIDDLLVDFNDFVLEFSSDLSFAEKTTIFEAMLKKTKASNNDSSYRALYLQYNQFKHYYNDQVWLDYFLKGFWTYGLDRTKPFTWFGWLFLIVICTNALFYPEISNKYLSISFLPDTKDESVDYNPLARLVYYFPYSIFLTIFLFLASFILSLRTMFPVKIKQDQLLLLSQSKRMVVLSYLFLIILLGYAYILFLFAFLIGE